MQKALHGIALAAWAVVLAAGLVVCPIPAFAESALTAGTADMQAASDAVSGTVELYAGADRHDTARRVTQAECEDAQASYAGIIVVACDGGRFPDALSAAGLSGLLGYPIVAVNGGSLSVYDRAALTSMKAHCSSGALDILVVGGTSAVSSAVQTSLESYGNVSRPFAGADRYDTNRLIYEYGVMHGGWRSSRAFFASGANFPDALAIAPFLVWAKCPIALVDPAATALTGTQLEMAAGVDQVIALGGTACVSGEAFAAAKAVTYSDADDRLGGDDRYATSAAIVEWELKQGMTLEGAGIATGETFPDALASSFLLGRGASVLMLVSPSGSNEDMAVAVASAATKGSPEVMRVFGGTSAVPVSAYSQMTLAAGWASYTASEKNEPMQSKAAFVKSASSCSQMIMVEATGATAELSMHEKDASGAWRELLFSGGYVGRGGVGYTEEGWATTPAGAFDIPFAFGNASNPSTTLPWHDTTGESTWVDEVDSEYYNTWQESSYFSGEHLEAIGWIYDYALVIGYNYPRYCTVRDSRTVSSGGSAFFVHCSEDKPTDGCISIPYDTMRRLVQLTKPGCLIVIGNPDTVYQY